MTIQVSNLYSHKRHTLHASISQLGEGAFSTVKLCTHKSTPSHQYAVKIVDKSVLTEEDTAALLDEVSILFSLKSCPHIIRLYDFFQEPTHYYLVMETMAGGELFDRIVKKSYYNEKEARGVCKILLEAVAYCHDARVVSVFFGVVVELWMVGFSHRPSILFTGSPWFEAGEFVIEEYNGWYVHQVGWFWVSRVQISV